MSHRKISFKILVTWHIEQSLDVESVQVKRELEFLQQQIMNDPEFKLKCLNMNISNQNIKICTTENPSETG